MTGKKADALTTIEDAAEVLHMDEAELAAAIEDGTLRRVRHADGAFILGVDVDKALLQSDPRYMAKVAAGEIIEDDDEGNNARTLAADLPRL